MHPLSPTRRTRASVLQLVAPAVLLLIAWPFLLGVSEYVIRPSRVTLCQPPCAEAPDAFVAELNESRASFGFVQPGFHTWGGSTVRAPDGTFHMFVSRWPAALGQNGWVTASEVVRAVAAEPRGPFTFAEVVLPRRAAEYWDGMMTHNPSVFWDARRQLFVLFYIGTTFPFMPPPAHAPHTNRTEYEMAWNGKRIGVAISRSVLGPWVRPDAPAFQPLPGSWDGAISSNPAPLSVPANRTARPPWFAATASSDAH